MARALVIFDFDGTLADSFVESLASYNRVAPRFRLRTVPGDEVASLRRLTVGQLMTTLGVPMWKLPRLMIAVRADLIEHFREIEPFPGIPRALDELRAAGHRLAVVTSNSKANVLGFLARHHLDLFSTVVAGASIFGKATRLRRLARAAQRDDARAIYVGDTTPDLRAARDAGMAAVGVTWGFADREPLLAERPDALIDAPAELPAAVVAVAEKG